MDPVGPWTAYAASYNRLASAGSFQNGQSEFHHLTSSGGPVQPPSSTSQLIFPPHPNSGFASTASPFNHNGFISPSPVTYDAVFPPLFHQKAHYRPLKQTDEYSMGTGMFDQNNTWSQNNPLPSPFGILPHESVATNSAKHYENYNFSTPFNAQEYKAAYDSKKRPPSPRSNSFYPESNFKAVDYQKYQNNLQSCAIPSKDYRIPQPPRQFQRERREFTPPAKIPDPERNSQSSPISFAMMDNRNYHRIRNQYNIGHYRYNSEDYRPKAAEAFSPTDCAKRQSPLQSPSQPTQSPVYPLYNSPMTSISSPSPVQPDPCYKNEVPPIDASLPRNLGYQSVITRNDKNYERADYNKQWEERQRRFTTYEAQTQRQPYLESQVPLQDLSSCRGDPMSLVKTLQQQQPEKTPDDKQKRKEKDYFCRIPPPAHNGNYNQNYYELERWNIPPGKMFSNTSTFTPVNNFPTQQSIVVPPPYYSAFQVPTTQQNEEEKNRPKSIPNIEEELSFLAEENFPWENNIKDKKKPSFMSSYVKFLQGDKDEAAPNPRPIPRTPWVETNSTPNVQVPTFPSDPQDDPRYFPLPKTSKDRKFDSSHSESEDKLKNKKDEKIGEKDDKNAKEENKSLKKKKKRRRRRMKKKFKEDDLPLPRRECAKRKAKDKLTSMNEENEEEEMVFSDLDPAWSPDSSDEDDNIVLTKRKRAYKKTKNKNKVKEESQNNNEEKVVEKLVIKKPHAVVSPMPSAPIKSHAQFPFNVGDYVVIKTDMVLANPPIWRVKEKAMLQKFTHFVRNGILLYVNLPCFTGWCPESKNVYEEVKVKTISQNKHEIIVQMISTGLHVITSGRDIITESMNETAKYQENFEVYIQTLFSQALDSNFLIEIFQEKDEYFLENVKAVDTLTSGMLTRLNEALDWPRMVTETTLRLPSYKIVQGPISSSRCICGVQGGASGVKLCGTPYHPDTLNPTEENIASLETSLCQTCIQYFEVLHKLCHQKFSLYAICTDRVNEKRAVDFNKDTTVLLNELLADDKWLAEIFKTTRSFWGYVEKIIYDIQRYKKNKDFSL